MYSMTLEINTSLKGWQQAAVAKLLPLRVGALYMDMGTGKTRTALELIKYRLDSGKIDAILWLCPYSIQKNLIQDFEKHCTGWEDIIRICGIETLSSSVKTNAELLQYIEKHRTFLVVDESSLVKNHRALRSEAVERLATKCPYKVILNGTPVSKNEKDLYQQWRILDWRILGYRSFWSFAANHLEYDQYGKIRRCLNIGTLTDKIAPYTYQVKREECMELPKKHYNYAEFDMGSRYDEYLCVLDQYLGYIDERVPTTLYKLFGALQAITSGLSVLSKPWEKIWTIPAYSRPEDNPRIEELVGVIEQFQGEKCIIFAKYLREIGDICTVLEAKGYTAVSYTGEMSRKKRDAALDAFRGNTQYLVANKACGAFGLNLQFAHNVVFYSNDWDYATRIQAEDRVHRFGQEHEVQIWDLYAANTIDDTILSSLARKSDLLYCFQQDIKGKQDVKSKIKELLCPKSTRKPTY